jgi:hypothetical protein
MSIKELKKLLRVDSESEAVQITVEDRVLAEKRVATAERIAKRGGCSTPLRGVYIHGGGNSAPLAPGRSGEKPSRRVRHVDLIHTH